MTQIQARYAKAPRIEGLANEITLADGTRIKGVYRLMEAGHVTASHSPFEGFRKSDGFPLDLHGQTVNDRDYERDTEAQEVTRRIAMHYDQRALQTAVVVTRDGIVLSGNGRTMAGDLAANWHTDDAYRDYLCRYPQQFGFTEGQVQQMRHPRVVFEVEDTPPYTTETFARFNAQEMKSMSKTEQAVKMGKLVSDELFHRTCRTINGFDTLGEFYGDTATSLQVVRDMVSEGVLSQMEMAAMMDGDRLSDAGQEVIENLLIGKAFAANPDAVRQTTSIRSMRKVVITALAEVVNSICLGADYSLEQEMAKAISLVYSARRTGGFHEGDRVSGFARQMTMFGDAATIADTTDGAMLLISDLLNDRRCTRLKKVLAIYNHHAHASACGQVDMFTGGVKTKEEILREVYQMLGCDAEIRELLGVAVRARKAASKREESGACSGDPEREQVRPKVKEAAKAAEPTLAERLREALLKQMAGYRVAA